MEDQDKFELVWIDIPKEWTGKLLSELQDEIVEYLKKKVEEGYEPISVPVTYHSWLFKKKIVQGANTDANNA
jgi:hypothetical protein